MLSGENLSAWVKAASAPLLSPLLAKAIPSSVHNCVSLGESRRAARLNSTALSKSLARRAERMDSRSEEHTSELQSRLHLVCRLLLEKKNNTPITYAKVAHSSPRSFNPSSASASSTRTTHYSPCCSVTHSPQTPPY